MVSMTDSLVETPPLGDPGSSTIEHDIIRRRPCANGWLVDVAPARVLPSALWVGASRWRIPRYCPHRDRRSWDSSAIASGAVLGPKGKAAGRDTLDATAVLMDRSLDPPAPVATAGSSGRGPWRSSY